MVDTIKFSQMTSGGDIAPGEKTPGLLSSENVLFNNAFPLLTPGTTAERPPISAAIYYRLRFNTSLESYEYYSPILVEWIQLQDSGDLLDAPFIIYTAHPTFPSAFNLGSLASGILKQNVTADIATPAIAVNGVDYYAPGFSDYFENPIGVKDVNGNIIVQWITAGINSVNYIILNNSTSGQIPQISAAGSDSDVGIIIEGKGEGGVGFRTRNTTVPFNFYSGTNSQHTTNFNMADTPTDRTVTWQDADGVVAFLSDIAGAVTSVSGTSNRVTSTGGNTPVIDISASYVGQSSITTLGTISTGVWQGTLVGGTYGGTGVNNGSSTFTMGGSHVLSGAFASTFTFTGVTGVTFPTSGTLATTSQIPTGAALTKTDDTNVTLTLGGSPTTALVNAASLTLGWTGQLGLTRGGSNASLTASNGGIIYSTASAMAVLAGTATANQLLLSGANSSPAWSSSTYPTSNAINTLLYASSANVMSALTTANNGVLITSAGGVPSISSTLPSGITLVAAILGTPASGTLTNCTGLPIAGITGFGTGVSTALGQAVTGSGGIALNTSPSFTTPILGIATASSISFSTNSGIIGTTNNTLPATGSVGQIVSNQVLASSPITLTSGVAANITNISLNSGDWDVYGNAGVTASGSDMSFIQCWGSTTSATTPDRALYTGINPATALLNFGVFNILPFPVQVPASTTTTVYLSVRAGFTVSGVAFGNIFARRRT